MERATNKERTRFLDIAKGSCAELRTQIYIGMDIGYITKSLGSEWVNESKELSAMLIGLIKSIKAEVQTLQTEG